MGIDAGPGGAAGASAAIKWISKDGIGALGRFAVSARFASVFDEDPRRWRLAAEAVTTLGLALEIATQAYPGGWGVRVCTIWQGDTSPKGGGCWRGNTRREENQGGPCRPSFRPLESLLGEMLQPRLPLIPPNSTGHFVLLAGGGNLATAVGHGLGHPCFRVIQAREVGG